MVRTFDIELLSFDREIFRIPLIFGKDIIFEMLILEGDKSGADVQGVEESFIVFISCTFLIVQAESCLVPSQIVNNLLCKAYFFISHIFANRS